MAVDRRSSGARYASRSCRRIGATYIRTHTTSVSEPSAPAAHTARQGTARHGTAPVHAVNRPTPSTPCRSSPSWTARASPEGHRHGSSGHRCPLDTSPPSRARPQSRPSSIARPSSPRYRPHAQALYGIANAPQPPHSHPPWRLRRWSVEDAGARAPSPSHAVATRREKLAPTYIQSIVRTRRPPTARQFYVWARRVIRLPSARPSARKARWVSDNAPAATAPPSVAARPRGSRQGRRQGDSGK